MKKQVFELDACCQLARDTWLWRLAGDSSAVTAPGQFVNIALEGLFLRRPISVCDWDEAGLTLVFKTVGRGTGQMARMQPGARVEALVGLGNGYDLAPAGPRPLLVGGGAGIPPLLGLARRLLAQGAEPLAVLGFNSGEELFLTGEFEALGAELIVATLDGSRGVRGLVTEAMPRGGYSYFYACGPEPMLRAVSAAGVTGGQLSFEERMGCGFGACMGCSCRTKYGDKRICADGPVLRKEEVIW